MRTPISAIEQGQQNAELAGNKKACSPLELLAHHRAGRCVIIYEPAAVKHPAAARCLNWNVTGSSVSDRLARRPSGMLYFH